MDLDRLFFHKSTIPPREFKDIRKSCYLCRARRPGAGRCNELNQSVFNMKRTVLFLTLLCFLTGCGMIKVSRSMLEMMLKGTNTVSTAVTYADSCDKRVGVPYVVNGDPNQVLDIYYAPAAVRKNAVLIDIHGGFYVAGKRENNRKFASVFLREGYDVVLLEYRLNDGKRDVADELADCAAGLDYLAVHARELGLDAGRMFLTGDSAGGHLALYMAEGAADPSMPIRPKVFTPRGTLINCPAYDFATFGEMGTFSKSALTWFIGPRYKDKKWMMSMSPRTYISTFEGPLLVSTCTRDFIRDQSLKIKADCAFLERPLEFVDIASDDKRVGHVHNVTAPTLPESQEVNARMVAFMNALLP